MKAERIMGKHNAKHLGEESKIVLNQVYTGHVPSFVTHVIIKTVCNQSWM